MNGKLSTWKNPAKPCCSHFAFSKFAAQDKNISWIARGVLCWVHSFEGDVHFSEEAQGKAFNNAIEELASNGYLEKCDGGWQACDLSRSPASDPDEMPESRDSDYSFYSGGSGFVYFVRAGESDRYKIGLTSTSVKQRMRGIETNSPLPISLIKSIKVNDVGLCETWMHRRFCHLRVKGEWFEMSENQARAVASTMVGLEAIS